MVNNTFFEVMSFLSIVFQLVGAEILIINSFRYFDLNKVVEKESDNYDPEQGDDLDDINQMILIRVPIYEKIITTRISVICIFIGYIFSVSNVGLQ